MQEEERARINHKSGNNCAMSVFLAYADRLGLTPEQASHKPLGKTCNDYVGDAARLVGEVLGE